MTDANDKKEVHVKIDRGSPIAGSSTAVGCELIRRMVGPAFDAMRDELPKPAMKTVYLAAATTVMMYLRRDFGKDAVHQALIMLSQTPDDVFDSFMEIGEVEAELKRGNMQ